MKFGVLINKRNINIGDDIQAYAASCFLPSVDYTIDRETINSFQSENNEPVAVIMNAWYMWEKWNWPPSRCIVPHMVGIHYTNYAKAKMPGAPINFEALTGLGGDYMRAYGPIGCRDMYTLSNFQKLGIDSYFSGCITMTIPKLPEKKSGKEYICIVDVGPDVEHKLKQILKHSGYKLRFMTHNIVRDLNRPWGERKKMVEGLLSVYRNAKCVITGRLHCSLPCLSQETPVVLIMPGKPDIRLTPYYDLLHYIPTKDFFAGNYDYDFTNPKPNKPDYRDVQSALIRSCTDFVDRMVKEKRDITELDRLGATDTEILRWQCELMEQTMHAWMKKTNREYKELRAYP